MVPPLSQTQCPQSGRCRENKTKLSRKQNKRSAQLSTTAVMWMKSWSKTKPKGKTKTKTQTMRSVKDTDRDKDKDKDKETQKNHLTRPLSNCTALDQFRVFFWTTEVKCGPRNPTFCNGIS